MAGRREKRGATPAGRARREVSDQGVRHCIELMTSGRWVIGKSGPEVAAKFKVSPETVKEWAVSASRCIRICIEDEGAREDIKARMIATLDYIVGLNVEDDSKVAVSAIAEQGKLLGLVTQNHKVDLRVEQFEQLEPQALRAKLLEQRSKIDKALAKLDVDHPRVVEGLVIQGEHGPIAVKVGPPPMPPVQAKAPASFPAIDFPEVGKSPFDCRCPTKSEAAFGCKPMFVGDVAGVVYTHHICRNYAKHEGPHQCGRCNTSFEPGRGE